MYNFRHIAVKNATLDVFRASVVSSSYKIAIEGATCWRSHNRSSRRVADKITVDDDGIPVANEHGASTVSPNDIGGEGAIAYDMCVSWQGVAD